MGTYLIEFYVRGKFSTIGVEMKCFDTDGTDTRRQSFM